MPETRRMSETELFLYNIVCPARSGGATNTKGSVCFRAVSNGLTAESYRAMWWMYLKEVMSASARDLGVEYAVLAAPYIQTPPMQGNKVYRIDSITTDMDVS